MSGTKVCPKVILEGTRLTGKTDLAFALNEHLRLVGPRRYRYRLDDACDRVADWLERRDLLHCRPAT